MKSLPAEGSSYNGPPLRPSGRGNPITNAVKNQSGLAEHCAVRRLRTLITAIPYLIALRLASSTGTGLTGNHRSREAHGQQCDKHFLHSLFFLLNTANVRAFFSCSSTNAFTKFHQQEIVITTTLRHHLSEKSQNKRLINCLSAICKASSGKFFSEPKNQTLR